MDKPVRLVVVGDSTAFTDDHGPVLPGASHVYPEIVAAVLREGLERDVVVSVLARPGDDTRAAARTLTKDRHAMFEVLMGADAVIVGIGSTDHAPNGVPPAIDALIPFIRPAALRRRARTTVRALNPVLTTITGSRITRTPAGEFARLFDLVLTQVRGLARGAAGVVLGPTSHRSSYYGPAHPQLAARELLQFEIAARHGFPTVPCWPLVEPSAGRLNPDGIHWPSEAHAAVGLALAAPLLAQLRDEAPRPPWPGETGQTSPGDRDEGPKD